nr:MAG TPA: hypothetical protein [Caudoviricetes sp.]
MKRCHKIISRNQRKPELLRREEEDADPRSLILYLHYAEISSYFQPNT